MRRVEERGATHKFEWSIFCHFPSVGHSWSQIGGPLSLWNLLQVLSLHTSPIPTTRSKLLTASKIQKILQKQSKTDTPKWGCLHTLSNVMLAIQMATLLLPAHKHSSKSPMGMVTIPTCGYFSSLSLFFLFGKRLPRRHEYYSVTIL